MRIPDRPNRQHVLACLAILFGCLAVLAAAVLLATVVAAAPAAASGASPGPSAPPPTWGWPVQPPVVLRAFALPSSPWGAGHRGVDLGASAGHPVRTAGAGVVTYAGPLAGRGVVAVTHGVLRTTYEPVRATVRLGERVQLGQVIGRLEGSGGHCTAQPCLHWGLLRGREYLDPLTLLRRGPSRLLPIWSASNPGGSVSVPRPDPVAPAWGRSRTAPIGQDLAVRPPPPQPSQAEPPIPPATNAAMTGTGVSGAAATGAAATGAAATGAAATGAAATGAAATGAAATGAAATALVVRRRRGQRMPGRRS
jgi:peptidase M23-like protein